MQAICNRLRIWNGLHVNRKVNFNANKILFKEAFDKQKNYMTKTCVFNNN